jgi:DNA polymerase I-like protein with 3'-5' exonuclease and polymerase domains
VCFVPDAPWRPPGLDSLPDWGQAKRVGIDTETRDPLLTELGPGVRRGGYICGFSFALEDGPRFYLPVRHEGGDNLPVEGVLRYLRDQAARYPGVVVGANMGYDLDYMAQEGIEFKSAQRFRDVQIADPLIDELQTSYSLQAISERHGFVGKDEGVLRDAAAAYNLDPKKDMWRLPARFVGAYGEEDASLPLAILRKQERVIDDEGLWDIYNLESDLVWPLVKVRRRGIRVSLERLEQIERWTLEQEAEAFRLVRERTGCRLTAGDVWVAEAMAAPLRAIGVVFKPGLKVSVTKELLEGLKDPVADALLKARKVNKLRTTFAASVRRHLTGGKIHCTLNQLRKTKDGGEDGEDSEESGARYGRLSCSDPNMQQQPARDEFAKMWRSIYLPEEGEEWASSDYSQQEPRWLTHYAELCKMRGAAAAAERYRRDPSTDNHDMMTRLVHGAAVDSMDKATYKRERTYCKQIFLGLCYGMGGAKLSRKISLPTKWVRSRDGKRSYEVAGDEAQLVLDKFDAGAPYVRQLAGYAEQVASEKGYITTVLGRRCRFPPLEGGGWDWCHKALNRLIQGTSADQTKKAMVEADRAGLYITLQVHDEIAQSIARHEQARMLEQIMFECVPSNVPAKIDTEIGESWGGSM